MDDRKVREARKAFESLDESSDSLKGFSALQSRFGSNTNQPYACRSKPGLHSLPNSCVLGQWRVFESLGGLTSAEQKKQLSDGEVQVKRAEIEQEALEAKGNILPWFAADSNVGKRRTIEGKVVLTKNIGHICFLNFATASERQFPFQSLKSVSRNGRCHQRSFFNGKTIHVTGKITIHKGKPQNRSPRCRSDFHS